MFIETTFIKYGKGPGGLIGVTLNTTTVKKWINGLHICTRILENLDTMREEVASKEENYHKEEMRSRIESEAQDRMKIER